MYRIIFSALLLLYGLDVYSQLNDNTWYLGYGPFLNKISFDDGFFSVSIDSNFTGRFYDNTSIYSDGNGQYMASFNGLRIYDSDGLTMLNGDSIWYETLPFLFGYSDEDLPQGSLLLPWPNQPDSLLLFYMSQGNSQWPDSLDIACLDLFYGIISQSGNNGKGAVINRRISLLNDTLQYGQLTAVRHANGRDWWILVNEGWSNRYYRILLDPSGLKVVGTQAVDVPLLYGFGQSVFSPNGNYFAVKNSVGNIIGNSLDIFQFDRCSGLLSNQFHLQSVGSSIGGVAFSPNSRFLYVSTPTELYQFDLLASDLGSSKILVGEYDLTTGMNIKFRTMQLAFDNRIYMCSNNSSKFIHVIDQPDNHGLSCNFQPRAINLFYNNFASLPNFPYFRLGPLDNSECDSLNLDNNPKAQFRYHNDSLDILNLTFRDLSYYNPNNWAWNFGDNSLISFEKNPTHKYLNPGTYYVCLTVSNNNSSDKICKPIQIGTTTTEESNKGNSKYFLNPNPFHDYFELFLPDENGTQNIFALYNDIGQKVINSTVSHSTVFPSKNLQNGIYFWEIREYYSGNVLITGEAIKN